MDERGWWCGVVWYGGTLGVEQGDASLQRAYSSPRVLAIIAVGELSHMFAEVCICVSVQVIPGSQRFPASGQVSASFAQRHRHCDCHTTSTSCTTTTCLCIASHT